MSIVISKLVGLLIFAAWFVVGTLVIRGIERGFKSLKNAVVTARTAKA